MSTAGLYFHVVNRAAKRSTLFESAADYAAFERVLALAIARSDVSLFAYCVMPNHWHLLLSPQSDGALSRFMHWLTTTHARRWQTLRDLDGQGAVYQGRFKAIPIGDDRHFLWVCRYVERNPLRAGLVDRAQEWRWSSLTKRRDDEQAPHLSEWPVKCPAKWVEQVNQPQTEAELKAFREAMARSEPFGDNAWTKAVKERLGVSNCARRGRRMKARDADCPQQMTPDPITNM
ncbi:MAG TPA: transposase [Vicinamibacterales bacterium]|nr:transposase [Vicinamibacterales bacterium]